MKRVLLAGVGNVLRGDDGFGIRALERLRSGKLASNPSVRFWESGIAGVSLVQELMDRYDALVVLDAVDRGGEIGELFVLEPDSTAIRAEARMAVDLHETKPDGVLRMAAALDVLPDRVWIVGAQPGECDELTDALTPAVAAAVHRACARVESIVSDFLVGDVAKHDEILQILFWLKGEKLAEEVTPRDLERWLSLSEEEIAPVLERMHGFALVEKTTAGRFRLTAEGAREGGRRFADEFSDMTKPGHGECGDPECDCYTTGDPADCRHNVV